MTEAEAIARAEAQILHDLVDSLFAEQVFAEADTELDERAGVWRWWLSRDGRRQIVVPVRRGFVQEIELLPGQRPLLIEPDKEQLLDADGFMAIVSEYALSERGNTKGVALFREMLADARAKAALSFAGVLRPNADTMTNGAATFLALERWASLRDRPYHPVGKAKPGFDEGDYRLFMAEFGAELTLDWIAVPRDALRLGVDALADRPPSSSLLDAARARALNAEMQSRGLDVSHVAIPLHPWQCLHAIPTYLGEAVTAGTCVPLDTRIGRFAATSSLRSLAPLGVDPVHLKLPLAVHSLAASRYLPAVKMINGQRSERLIRDALTRDLTLAPRIFLCEEGDWWAYLPQGASLYDEAPRHLSVMVRRYPASLIEHPDYRLVPMAALGVADPDWHYFDIWLRDLGRTASPESAMDLFATITLHVLESLLRMFRLGLLPEAHGQNALLVLRNGAIEGLLLRDHDSLRLHVPWLEREGLADPRYEIKPGHANTLYHDTPEALLFWLQTLVIQVNLRAILESVAMRYGVAEARLWRTMRDATAAAINAILPERSLRRLLEHELLERADWPLKHLILPIIARAGGPGSMPFGVGRTCNPLALTQDAAVLRRVATPVLATGSAL